MSYVTLYMSNHWLFIIILDFHSTFLAQCIMQTVVTTGNAVTLVSSFCTSSRLQLDFHLIMKLFQNISNISNTPIVCSHSNIEIPISVMEFSNFIFSVCVIGSPCQNVDFMKTASVFCLLTILSQMPHMYSFSE